MTALFYILGGCAVVAVVLAIWVRIVDSVFVVPGPQREELDEDGEATGDASEDDGDVTTGYPSKDVR